MLALIDGTNAVLRYKDALPPEAAVAKASGRMHEFCTHVGATHAIIALDPGGPTQRSVLHAGYKADRPDNDEYHSAAREVLADRGWYWLEVRGHEADDVIATFATRAKRPLCVLSSDSDLWSLVSPKVRVYRYGEHGIFDEVTADVVMSRFGVRSDQLEDFKALVGEEGVKGVKGVGKKTAAKYLAEHDTIGGLIANKLLTGEKAMAAINAKVVLMLHHDVSLPHITPAECVVPNL